MNSPLRIASLIPENAPFSPEQRTWLNGFFAGFVSIEGEITPLSPSESEVLLPGFGAGADADEDDGAPWHDQTLPLTERMKLAEARPLPRRMMAAMAQQDCGQCGYNCHDYAEALFARSEDRLNLCVPGGKETARMLKTLYQELERPAAAPVPAQPTARSTQQPSAAPGTSRDNPVLATFLSRT